MNLLPEKNPGKILPVRKIDPYRVNGIFSFESVMHQASPNEKRNLLPGKNPGKILPAQKNPGKFFGREKIFLKNFLEKSGYALTRKTKSIQITQKPSLTCQNPHLSDVIAIEGFQQPFLHLFDLKPMPKKGARKSPLNCRLKSRLNCLYFKNNHFERYFLSAWTPLPLEPENRVRKKAIGARIGLILSSLFIHPHQREESG